jgi:hypothetical protein
MTDQRHGCVPIPKVKKIYNTLSRLHNEGGAELWEMDRARSEVFPRLDHFSSRWRIGCVALAKAASVDHILGIKC